MLAIADIADKIGDHICQHAGLESERNKVCFGIEVVLIMTISALSTLLVAGMLGLFQETLIVLAAGLFMKFITGGPHLSGFFRCLIYSIGVCLAGAWLTHTYLYWLTLPVVVLLSILNTVILIFFPLLLSYRTLEPKQTRNRKLLAGSLIILSCMVMVGTKELYSAGIFMGFTITITNISPMIVRFMKWLDSL